MNRTHDTPVAQRPDRACAGQDPEIFFSDHKPDIALAIDLCNTCPHETDCLDWALTTGQTFGVLGGKTAGQRYTILKKRQEAS